MPLRRHVKKMQTHSVFDEIAKHYDFLNHLLSLNIDRSWRRSLLERSGAADGGLVLDACAGTCDIVLDIAGRHSKTRVVGIDKSGEMLRLGMEKVASDGVDGRVSLVEGDVLELPFAGETFDEVTIGYGLRNLANYSKGISEMARVLKPGGRLLILEFGPPMRGFRWAWYRWYLDWIVPVIGGMVSGKTGSYRYLSKSINSFLGEEEVVRMLEETGFERVQSWRLMGGISLLYGGVRKENEAQYVIKGSP
jgi:demethylmenaquinone methyltransferase/2-methoxy-6-polyprenyl-1,4-benzoquinol methylase